MDQNNEKCPWHEADIFNRIPLPETAPAKGFIGPKAAHAKTEANERHGYKRPWSRQARPVGEVFGDKRAHRIREENGERAEAQKDGGRMNDHPIVLERGSEAQAGGR